MIDDSEPSPWAITVAESWALQEAVMANVVERVDRFEEVLGAFVISVGIEFNKLYNSQMRT